MNFRRRDRVVSEVSTSSLNDIMFFLLLFFLITSTMVNPNVIKLTLPKATNKAVVQKNVTVSIDKEGAFYVNKIKTDVNSLADALQSELSKLKNAAKEPVVIINADESVPIKDVVKVMVIGKKINAKVLLATQKE
jgi:biopolymer transport protein ExbD